MSGPRKRAARLLRWYPGAWRARYGAEFTELLIADLAERPRSPARTADVIRGGIVARLTDAGLCGFAPDGTERAGQRARAGLASLACCAAVFLGLGGAIWSQLTIGWQWSAPDATAAVPTGSRPWGRRRCGLTSTPSARWPTSGCAAWLVAGGPRDLAG